MTAPAVFSKEFIPVFYFGSDGSMTTQENPTKIQKKKLSKRSPIKIQKTSQIKIRKCSCYWNQER
jgi:hypothetical protein